MKAFFNAGPHELSSTSHVLSSPDNAGAMNDGAFLPLSFNANKILLLWFTIQANKQLRPLKPSLSKDHTMQMHVSIVLPADETMFIVSLSGSGIIGQTPRHPIALTLHDAMQRAHLPAYHFKRTIDVCDTELHTLTHLGIHSLTSHTKPTSVLKHGTLPLALLLSLSSSTLSHAASHLGVAQTISK
ncbi:hypothetical protein JOM56_013045 [Amanita muscaria]